MAERHLDKRLPPNGYAKSAINKLTEWSGQMKKKTLKLGINEISNEDYHADTTFQSSSNLKLLLKEPQKFYDERILGKKERKHNPAFDEGSYTHSLILEPHMIKKEYAFFEGMRKAGKDWEMFSAQNQNKIILSKAQKMRVESWFRAYKKRPEAKRLISGGVAEQTIAMEYSGVKVKARCDYINADLGYIADVKTTAFPSDADSFKMTMDKYNYQLSAHMYAALFEQHYKRVFDFYFIVLGKKDLDCQVFKLSEKSRLDGQMQFEEAIRLYKKGLKNGWESLLTPQKQVDLSGDYEIEEV